MIGAMVGHHLLTPLSPLAPHLFYPSHLPALIPSSLSFPLRRCPWPLSPLAAALCSSWSGVQPASHFFPLLDTSPLPHSSTPQKFEPGQMRGHWQVAFSDEDLRVFYTNKGSLFVLKKCGEM